MIKHKVGESYSITELVAVLLMRFTWIITLPRELGSKWESCRSPYEILGDEVKVIGGVEFQVAVLLMRF